MRLVFIALASLVLAACNPLCPTRPDVDPGIKVTVPKEQTAYCDELPAFADKEYSEEELNKALNLWITAHERCASKHKVLSDFILKMYPQ